jgi:inosine-uridine nucleoside N-ribohydrolase
VKKLLLFFALAGLGFAQRERIILDTDCAIFNDDGAAMAMLLERPLQVDVIAVTLVPGNMWPMAGAEYMFRTLDAIKRPDVVLYAGAGAPLLHTPAMAEKESKEWGEIFTGALGEERPTKTKSSRRLSRRSAIDLMIEAIEKTPGEVTIVEIGPMTNLAIMLRLRPDLETKIKRLVFMGGGVHTTAEAENHRAAEFNFWFDPEAARIVLRSAIPEKIMIGLDLCSHARIDKAHYDEIISVKTPLTALYREDLKKTFAANPNATVGIWDCLVAAYVLDPKWVTKREQAFLDVDTTFGKNYGAVIPLDKSLAPEATPVDVLLDLDFDKFFALYKELLTKAP